MVMVDDGDGSGLVRIWWFLPGKCSTGLGKRVCFTTPKIKRWTIIKCPGYAKSVLPSTRIFASR
jgi:hypothetical protein